MKRGRAVKISGSRKLAAAFYRGAIKKAKQYVTDPPPSFPPLFVYGSRGPVLASTRPYCFP
jgi:hypothetical protein